MNCGCGMDYESHLSETQKPYLEKTRKLYDHPINKWYPLEL
jgi:hypothetical protein